jgi:hypothetical protein
MLTRNKAMRTATGIVAIGMAAALGSGQTSARSDLTSLSAFADGVAAYIYGYPMMMVGLTERVATTTPGAIPNGGRAPLNQFAKATDLPNGSYKDVVLPSTSTLYASAFLNLSAEPVVLHLPVIDRFYLMQMLDAWTNVSKDSPGTRIGSEPGNYALVGPDWKKNLPSGVNVIHMPTNTMWIIGRIFTSGTQSDLDHVADDILPQLTLTPLSAFDMSYTPPDNLPVDPSIETSVPSLHQVANMDACAFFGTLAAMMKTNSPISPQDDQMVKRLAQIHIVPGQPFDCSSSELDAKTKAALQLAVVTARHTLQTTTGGLQPTATNWLMPLNVGQYGSQFLLRAIVAEKALGANLPEDAVYGYTTSDNGNNPVKGTNRYTVHWNAPTSQRKAGELPPVNAKGFWSVTIYKADGTLVDNKAVTYNAIGVGPLGPTIQAHNACFNPDGSLDLYLQTDPPSGATQFCNWIPIPPTGGATASDPDFIVFLRMYWPEQAVLSGKWIPPAIQKVD